MYKEHQAFETPTESTVIWRYMNFKKFESLLKEQAVYFSNFKYFEDRLEGRYPHGNWEYFNKLIEQTKKYNAENPDNPKWVSDATSIIEAHEITPHMAGGHFINSWHQNECESIIMWKKYSLNSKGICIKSNIRRLKECFAEDEQYEVKIATVNYIDYYTDFLSVENMFYLFTHKDKRFDYEREIRAYVFIRGRDYRDHKGIFVPVSLDALIEKVYVSPTVDDQFLDSVKSSTKKYNLKKEVIQSDLNIDCI